MPRDVVRDPEHNRGRSLGHLAVAWLEHFAVHGPGDVAGEPVALDDEFAGFVLDAYALDGDGRRLYNSAFLSRCKGRAKSELAGFLCLLEALGPCRFAGWAEGGELFTWRDVTYRYSRGEPMGPPITSPFVRCIATEELQSGHVYGVVFLNLTEGPLAEGLPSEAAGITRTLLPGGGEIRPSTAANASKDGGRESFAIFDETHLYTSAELRKMYATVRRNLTKRPAAEPWSLETSTMYLQGAESVAERSHELAGQIREGRVRTSRFLFDHCYGPPEVDIHDPSSLRAALAEALGDFAPFADLDRRVDEFYDTRNATAENRRFLLNVATAHDESWVTAEQWLALAAPAVVVEEARERKARAVFV